MEKGWHYITTRQNELEEFIRFHEARIKPAIHSRTLKLYINELPKELELLQTNHFLVDRDLYKEDHGTFCTLVSTLRKYFSVSSPGQADYILVPLNLYFHEKLEDKLIKKLIEGARSIASDKPIVLFCIGDFCLKTAARSTRLERQMFSRLTAGRTHIPGWIRKNDIVINFESTIDFIFDDIPAFPLIQLDPIDPLSSKKELLFSFTGEYYKEGWPEDFVRGSANREVWTKLKEDNRGDALIGPPDPCLNATDSNPFFQIPRKSVFTLCPRGIASWSFRVFEAILAGSIPVILSDSYTRPFSEYIPWDYFSLSFPEGSLPDIRSLLENIQPGVVASMTRHLKNNQHWFTASGLTDLIAKKLEHRLAM